MKKLMKNKKTVIISLFIISIILSSILLYLLAGNVYAEEVTLGDKNKNFTVTGTTSDKTKVEKSFQLTEGTQQMKDDNSVRLNESIFQEVDVKYTAHIASLDGFDSDVVCKIKLPKKVNPSKVKLALIKNNEKYENIKYKVEGEYIVFETDVAGLFAVYVTKTVFLIWILIALLIIALGVIVYLLATGGKRKGKGEDSKKQQEEKADEMKGDDVSAEDDESTEDDEEASEEEPEEETDEEEMDGEDAEDESEDDALDENKEEEPVEEETEPETEEVEETVEEPAAEAEEEKSEEDDLMAPPPVEESVDDDDDETEEEKPEEKEEDDDDDDEPIDMEQFALSIASDDVFLEEEPEEDDDDDDDDDDEEDDDDDDPSPDSAVAIRRIPRERRKLKPIVRAYYYVVKNKLMSKEKVRERYSKMYNSFSLGRQTVAKISLYHGTLRLYMALVPDTVDPKYYTVDVSDKKVHAKTPTLLKVKSRRGVRYALELLETLLADTETKENYKNVDFTKNFPYDEYGQVKDEFRPLKNRRGNVANLKNQKQDDDEK